MLVAHRRDAAKMVTLPANADAIVTAPKGAHE
uniref:Uncharacterized protein n=1 Tax=Arundo donax TaxID=35708 RepID=A0A0A9CJ46_ARUDO